MHQALLTYVIFFLASYGAFPWYGHSQSHGYKSYQELPAPLFYEEIHNMEYTALEEGELGNLKLLIQAHLRKATAENDSIERARAFYYKTALEDSKIALVYADSIILFTKTASHPNYPAIGYALKGHLYYQSGKFDLALTNYLQAYNLSLEKNNVEQQREFALAIAAIRNIYGQHYAAAELYNKSLNLLKTKKEFETLYYEDYITLLYNLSLTHLRLQSIDSAKYYLNVGMKNTLQMNDKENLQDFILLDAQVNYYDGKYGEAKDTLLKYIDSLDGTSKAIKLYYLGKIEDKLNNKDLSIAYFKQADSIVTETGDPFLEIKDIYHQLILHYQAQNDKKRQIEYIGKLITYDSIYSTKQEGILNAAMISYDIPFLKHQKKEAEAQLKAKRSIITTVGLIAVLGTFIGMYFYIRSVRMQKRLKLLLEGGSVNNATANQTNENSNSVPSDIRNDILIKLEKFESSEKFLNKDLDLVTLAQDLSTNTSYLSVVINKDKKKTFPSYLKDLRISKAINQLKECPELLKYNYQGLADIFGFKTGESFSKAFYQKTGVFPSKFLKELKSRNKGDHL